MNWTTDKPSEAGWYHMRNIGGKYYTIIKVWENKGKLYVGGSMIHSCEQYEWAGPIPEPDERPAA